MRSRLQGSLVGFSVALTCAHGFACSQKQHVATPAEQDAGRDFDAPSAEVQDLPRTETAPDVALLETSATDATDSVQSFSDIPQPRTGDASDLGVELQLQEIDAGENKEAVADLSVVGDLSFDDEADEKVFQSDLSPSVDYTASSDWFDSAGAADCPYPTTGGATKPTVFCNDQECCLSGATTGPCSWTKCCGDAAVSSKWVPGDYCQLVMGPTPPGATAYGPCPAILKYENNVPALPVCNPECWCE